MVVHAVNPTTQEAEEDGESEAGLVYSTLQGYIETLSQKPNQNKRKVTIVALTFSEREKQVPTYCRQGTSDRLK